ncbi:hypothetical protein AgCh_034663 [Apium graveolens]
MPDFCSIDETAKDFVLAEKPVISVDLNLLDPPLLDELLANIGEARYSVSPTHEIDNRGSPPPNASIAPHASVRPPVPAAPKGHFLDLMWDGDSKWNVPDKDLKRLHLPLMVTHKDNEEKLTIAFIVSVDLERLHLPLMVTHKDNEEKLTTAFAVSVDAKKRYNSRGLTLASKDSKPEDFNRP